MRCSRGAAGGSVRFRRAVALGARPLAPSRAPATPPSRRATPTRGRRAGPTPRSHRETPWEYRLRHDQGDRRNAILYPTMTTEEIKAIPIQQLAAEDSILWLWTTNSHLPDALEIAKGWGFEYKVLLTWVKNRIGTGYWLRGRTEHCIMAVKGHPLTKLTNQSTVLHAPVRAHSQKPDEFYRLVETLCPGRKIELFARENRDGWDTWLTSVNISRTAGL